MESTKGYSEVSQEVQEGWLKDTFDKVVDTLGLGDADRDRVTDAAEAKQAEIDALEAKVQAELDKKANDKFQNDRIDSIANASDAEAKARADAQAAKDAEAGTDDADDAATATAATTTTAANTTTARQDKVAKTDDLANKTTAADKTPPTGPGGDEALPTSSGTATAATSQGQDNNPNTDGGQQRNTRQGQDNNPNTGGGQAADPDATDPRGDQTNPPANTQGGAPAPDTSNAAAMAAGQAGAAATTAPSNGSLLGRKLDTTTANLMKAYNDGGKKAMPEIKNLQTALSRLGHDPNGIDGKYGNGTYAAVQAFQKANGLSVDGQAGPGTMTAIKKALDDNFEKNKVTPDAQEKPAGSGQDNNPNAPTDQEGGVAQGIDQADDVGDDGMTDAERDAGAGQFANDPQATDPNARATRGSDSAFANDPQAAAPKVSKEVYIQGGGGVTNFNIAQMKQKYPNTYVEIPQEDGNVTRGYGPLKNLQAYKKKNPAAKIIGQQEAGKPNAERDGAERGVQTASKDNNMKKAIKEASMNISINGDSAAEVAELAGILKNAGMHDAKPVSDIMPHAHDGHDDMVSKMRMMDQPAPDDSPCGMDEEGVEEDWDNSPDESYADHQTMTHDLSGGINRRKPQGAIRVKDPAVALETSIKEQLWAALNEKMTAEGRGRGKKMKLKASRGNEDIKTTEGSRGKKSRGKKSRG